VNNDGWTESRSSKRKRTKRNFQQNVDWNPNPIKGVLGKRAVEIQKTIRSKPSASQLPGLFLSKYAGRCKACSEPIAIGEWVSKSRIKGVVHPRCIGKDRENSLE
jgi:hypothetical protein